jgi:hypothetical protein
MTPIETNKPVFFDSDGSVLEGGEIYIGQPGTDPRTNAKTVTFRDAGGSEFTAAQPLNTLNGRIVYNGKPIVALVDGEHSMLVINSANVQVDYSRSVNAGSTDPVGIVGFSELIRVGLTLPAIKLFNVNVGESVRNIGKATATDALGANWLVTSASGTPGDDKTVIDFSNGLQGVAITNNRQFTGTPVGGILFLYTNMTGVIEPPTNSGQFRYVNLLAGLTGVGEYNNGVLSGESVSGSSPNITATATVSVGPLAGEVVNLINTERRFIRPGSSGTTQEGQIESHAHTQSYVSFGDQIAIGGETERGVTATTATTTAFGGDETRPRNIGMTAYLRIL